MPKKNEIFTGSQKWIKKSLRKLLKKKVKVYVTSITAEKMIRDAPPQSSESIFDYPNFPRSVTCSPIGHDDFSGDIEVTMTISGMNAKKLKKLVG